MLNFRKISAILLTTTMIFAMPTITAISNNDENIEDLTPNVDLTENIEDIKQAEEKIEQQTEETDNNEIDEIIDIIDNNDDITNQVTQTQEVVQTFNESNIASGKYKVSVALTNDKSMPTMVSSALSDNATLTVLENGSSYIELSFGSVCLATASTLNLEETNSISTWINSVEYYVSNDVNVLSNVKINKKHDNGSISIAKLALDNTSDGVILSITNDIIPVPQDAFLSIDFANATKIS